MTTLQDQMRQRFEAVPSEQDVHVASTRAIMISAKAREVEAYYRMRLARATYWFGLATLLAFGALLCCVFGGLGYFVWSRLTA